MAVVIYCTGRQKFGCVTDCSRTRTFYKVNTKALFKHDLETPASDFHWSPLPLELGHVMAQLVEALRYKPEGSGFDYRWGHWNFSLT
jgi:hypothetical protein